MEEIYGAPLSADYSDKTLMTPENLIFAAGYQSFLPSSSSGGAFHDRNPMFGSDELLSAITEAEPLSVAPEIQPDDDASTSSLIKAKIASHPHYPRLLQAFIDCQKVGATPEIAGLLDEIKRDNDVRKREVVSTCFGDDPELDEFMETYCDLLIKYKSDLSRPFDEATTFLNDIEIQLSHLCCGASVVPTLSDDGGMSSEDGDAEDASGSRGKDGELKDRLLNKFGGRIRNLKLEFSKKKKKGKLPEDARQTLLDWWNVHYKWPYPTEGDKIELAKSTGLDQKQINNWFINQRKRHWKPSENLHFSVTDTLTGGFYSDPRI